MNVQNEEHARRQVSMVPTDSTAGSNTTSAPTSTVCSRRQPKRSLSSVLGAEAEAERRIRHATSISLESARAPTEVETNTIPSSSASVSPILAHGEHAPQTGVTQVGTAPSPGSQSRTPLPSLPELYVDTLVAFSPAKESWMRRDYYKVAGVAYIVGRVCRLAKRQMLYEVRWLDSQFQSHVETLTLNLIQRGQRNYNALRRLSSQPGWRRLCEESDQSDLPSEQELEPCEAHCERYEPAVHLPATLADVEAIKNMNFDPQAQLQEPTDKFRHSDGSTRTRLRPEFVHLFSHSASSSFLAYLPVYFWEQVLNETNTYVATKPVPDTPPFTLQEMMTFLGILFYMGLTDKGEYANYWGEQLEDTIFGGMSMGLERIMPLKRFKRLRQAFCFRCLRGNGDSENDAAARLRPIMNMLKASGPKYVELGRDVALDETSVACRSKFGRKLIFYNPSKPTGKYHFRVYMLSCATTWIALNFRLHCESDLSTRLEGIATAEEAQQLSEELQKSSKMRKLVVEVVRPIYNTNRVVNTDNYYTSVQLLQALRVKGLYGRGTVRGNSAHFPKHVMLDKNTHPRGSLRQGVCAAFKMIAACWVDNSVVTVVSNADASTISSVERQIHSSKQTFNTPTCVKNYNCNMQGVDRLDQLRARFSIADGHSFKKWFKKLAFAFVDIARVNGYASRRMALDSSGQRDAHRAFVTELAAELISGSWADAPSERQMLFSSPSRQHSSVTETSPSSAVWSNGEDMAATSSPKKCSTVSSKQMFSGSNRKRRQCIVCRWEGRWPTQVTDYCVLHSVCLCQLVHTTPDKPYVCPQRTWTCWEKYHRFYLPHKLFSAKGRLRKSSALYKLKISDESTDQETSGTDPVTTTVL